MNPAGAGRPSATRSSDIRAHDSETDAGLCLSEELRRDAAATLIAAACAPFDKPALRQTLEQLKKETEQAIDIYKPDEVLEQGFDAAAKAKAAGLVQAFRDYLAANHAQIDALQILYSRPFKQRLTEPMLKELEKKLRDNLAAWTEDNLGTPSPPRNPATSRAARRPDVLPTSSRSSALRWNNNLCSNPSPNPSPHASTNGSWTKPRPA